MPVVPSRLSAPSPAVRLLVALACMVCASALQASTIVVNDASSGSVAGKCTIQDAVAAANTNAAVNACSAGAAGADTITFAPGITTVTLSSAMTSANALCAFGLVITDDLTIDGGAVTGSGVPKVTIARSNAVFDANNWFSV